MSTETANQLVKPNGRPAMSPLYGMAQRYQIEPDKLLATLRATVIKPTNKHTATNEEVSVFCIVANQYGLNPFTREIYAFVGQSGQITPIVGVDGWVTLVNRQPDYDGVEFEEISDESGLPVATTCRMHVKGRSYPIKVTEHIIECRRETGPWKTMPRRMLRHKAYIQAARYAFGLSGIHDEDEANDIRMIDNLEPEKPTSPPIGRRRAPVKSNDETERVAEPEAEETTEPIAEEAQAQPEPEAPNSIPSAEEVELENLKDDLWDSLERAETEREMNRVGERLMKEKLNLGPERFDPLLKRLQTRNRLMKEKAGKV